eukprot:2538909-Prorocentrum_lima.AAC.1
MDPRQQRIAMADLASAVVAGLHEVGLAPAGSPASLAPRAQLAAPLTHGGSLPVVQAGTTPGPW